MENLDFVVRDVPVFEKHFFGDIENLVKEPCLSEKQAHRLLDFIVFFTREKLEYLLGGSIKDADLIGYCGFAQYLSLTSLLNINKEITINNISSFTNEKYFRHAFGTVNIPVKKGKSIIFKRYLIDVTYRQFFTKMLCFDSLYHDPGYFLTCKFRSKKNLRFVSELIRKGYVELTEDNLLIYVRGFLYSAIERCICESDFCAENKDKIKYYFYKKVLVEYDGLKCLNILLDKQVRFDESAVGFLNENNIYPCFSAGNVICYRR